MPRLVFLIPLIALFLILRPDPVRAETRVYVTFSIGGAAVIGAGVIYWSLSYSSRISEHQPSPEPPHALSFAQIESHPKFGADTQSDLLALGAVRQADILQNESRIEVPLLVYRW